MLSNKIRLKSFNSFGPAFGPITHSFLLTVEPNGPKGLLYVAKSF